MATYFPTAILLVLESFRPYCPAHHCAYFRGYIRALAILGTTRKCMTNIARSCVFVERHLASWDRFLAEAQWDLRGVSPRSVTQLLQQLGASRCFWDALLATVDTTLRPKVRGQMPGVQKWPDHSGNPARRASLVGHHGALTGLVSAWKLGYLCWPVLARLLAGQLNPLGLVAGADGVQRLDFWWVVVALVRELQQRVGERSLRVVADASFSKAAFLNPLAAAGITVLSRLRKDAVGWDDPAPVGGKRPRGRPRKKGRTWKLATVHQIELLTALTVVTYGTEEPVHVVGRDVWLREVTPKVRVWGRRFGRHDADPRRPRRPRPGDIWPRAEVCLTRHGARHDRWRPDITPAMRLGPSQLDEPSRRGAGVRARFAHCRGGPGGGAPGEGAAATPGTWSPLAYMHCT
jgi:DDE superfamily endonuclease